MRERKKASLIISERQVRQDGAVEKQEGEANGEKVKEMNHI